MFEKLINIFPVIRNHPGSIRRLLHSSLNLEGIDTSLVKLLQILNPTHILKTQYITVFLISFVILIKYGIRKTARLRATSSITASTTEHAAEQTLSGIAITQCTVHKCFQFHTRLIIDPFHLGQRNLPCHHDTLCAESLHHFRALNACHRHLRTSMDWEIRKMPPNKRKDSHILHQHSIQSLLIERKKIVIKFARQFRIFEKRINRKINLRSMKMCIINRCKKLLRRKIIGIRTGSEQISSNIDRIRPGSNHRLKDLKGTCRRQ